MFRCPAMGRDLGSAADMLVGPTAGSAADMFVAPRPAAVRRSDRAQSLTHRPAAHL